MPDLFTAEEAGVTVTKHVDINDDEVKIGLRLESSRECSLAVCVMDTVPTNTTVQVPTTHPSHWSTNDETVEYKRTLEPEESVTTRYKYTAAEAETTTHQPPELVVDGEATSDNADTMAYAEEADTQASVSHDTAEDTEFEMAEDEVSVGDIVGDTTTDTASAPTETTASVDGGDAAVIKSQPTEDATRAAEETVNKGDELVDMVVEMLDADASQEQHSRLANELSDLDISRSSLELRVMYLQSQLQDLATYTDAMEEFLDEHGTGESVLTEVLDELHAVREQLECVREEQAAIDTRLEAFEDRTGQLETRFESRQEAVDADLSQVEATLESQGQSVNSELRTLEDTVEDVEENQATVQDQIEQLTAFRNAMQDAFQGEAVSTDN